MHIGIITIQYLHEIINVINHFIIKEEYIINTKRIREFYKISANERSRINFIWRFLNLLENKGYLELIQENPTKTYRLPQSLLNFDEVLNQLKNNNIMRGII